MKYVILRIFTFNVRVLLESLGQSSEHRVVPRYQASIKSFINISIKRRILLVIPQNCWKSSKIYLVIKQKQSFELGSRYVLTMLKKSLHL